MTSDAVLLGCSPIEDFSPSTFFIARDSMNASSISFRRLAVGKAHQPAASVNVETPQPEPPRSSLRCIACAGAIAGSTMRYVLKTVHNGIRIRIGSFVGAMLTLSLI